MSATVHAYSRELGIYKETLPVHPLFPACVVAGSSMLRFASDDIKTAPRDTVCVECKPLS